MHRDRLNFILCGLPASAKTTVGKLLARNLSRKFIDTDHLIEEVYASNTGKNMVCSAIYTQEGEEFFRHLEREQIASLKGVTSSVISLGGGSLLHSDNLKVVQELGILIYLKGSLPLLWKRIQVRGFPAYLDRNNPEQAFYSMAAKRSPIFEAHSHQIILIDTLCEEKIVELILNSLQNYKDKGNHGE